MSMTVSRPFAVGGGDAASLEEARVLVVGIVEMLTKMCR